MESVVTLIGFGEAARAFAPGLVARLTGYDRKTGEAATRGQKLDEFAQAGVAACDTPAAALAGVGAALSLVTADQALAAAANADGLPEHALWFDMNSVAPATKRAAAAAIARIGGRYVDAAVMAPVHPKRTAVPILLSGPHAAAGAEFLCALGFSSVRSIAGEVGAASAVKMVRSVMVKGIEALTAECALAADAAGVLDEVVASFDASIAPERWSDRFDYNLDRMLIHGLRRAAEMDEVVATLDALGTGSAMSRATAERQRALGRLSIAPPDGLAAKLRTVAPLTRPAPGNRAA